MTKSILKYAILLSIALAILSALTLVNSLTYNKIIPALRFGAVGGMMMFGINDFIIKKKTKLIYKYSLGFAMALAIGFLGQLIFQLIALGIDMLVTKSNATDLDIFRLLVSGNLPMVILLSFICPLAFISTGGESEKSKDDLLDSDLYK